MLQRPSIHTLVEANLAGGNGVERLASQVCRQLDRDSTYIVISTEGEKNSAQGQKKTTFDPPFVCVYVCV